jgi:hypothetical protein
MSFVSDHFTRDNIPALPGSGDSLVQRPSSTIFVRFFEKAQATGTTDENTGLPGYRRVETIEIHIPGDKNSVVHKRVTPEMKHLYAKEYDAYRQGKEYEGDGLPLAKWPQIPIEQIEGLRHLKIYTVEALAGLSDAQCGNAMGLRALREKAKLHLEAAKSSAPLSRLADENEALKNRLALMETQMAQVLASVKEAKGDDTQKRGPGRPRKDQSDTPGDE